MPATPPPTLDDAQPKDVPKTGKERVLGAVGGVLAAGGGKDRSESPLVQAMQKHHQQRIDLAQKHYKDFQTYTGILATGINPDTGKPLTAEEAEKYYNLREAASGELEKTAGVNKDVKGKLQKLKMIADHIVKLHPKAGAEGAEGGGGQSAGAGGGAPSPRMTPPPSATQSLEQNADVPRLREEMADQREFNFWKKQQEVLKDFKIEEAKAAAQAKAANPSSRPVMGPAVSVKNARELAKQGKSFKDIDGNPIDLTDLPDSMGLKNIVWGGKSYYEPFSPNSKVVTVGNETYAISPMDVEALSQGTGTDLGAHRVGTASSSEQGIDPITGTTKTQRTSAPATQGAKGRPTPPPKAGVAGGGGASSSKDLLPTNATAKRVAPVRGAMTQLFGDPTQPSLKGLKDYAQVADDPKASKRVGAAVQLVLKGMEQQEKAAGSFLRLLENYGGVPQALIDSQLAINKDVIGKLSPEEAEAFNATISAISTVVGLRSLTTASAAQASVRALERDIPIPGYNTFDSKQFNYKLSRLAEEVYSGSRTVPLPKEEREFIKNQVDELKKKSSASKSPTRMTPPPKASENPLDDEIRKAAKEARKPAA